MARKPSGGIVGDAFIVDDRVNDDEDEDDEEGEDGYERDGFVVDDDDEEEREEEEEKRQKKKKRKKSLSEKNYVLDEDDYELLQDNNITGFRRPKLESKMFKRLKKDQSDTQEDSSGFFDDEEFDGSGKSARTAEEKLKQSLFGDDEGSLEDIAEEEEQLEEEEDEIANFIVNKEEDDEHGDPVRQRKLDKKNSMQAAGLSSSAEQEAHGTFGDVDELLRLQKQGFAKMGKYDYSRELRERRVEDDFEPIVLSEKYMTEKDDQIREIDLPERMQISEESTGPPPTDEMSIEEEGNWIYNQLTTIIIPLFSKRGTGTTQGEIEMSINKDEIMRFLEFMHVQKLDVPFIAMYRKEECQSLLRDPEKHEADIENQNKPDQKPTIRWHKVLWAIQDLDRKWLLLQKRKSALQSYYSKRFEEEYDRIYDDTRLSLNQQLFESITKSLKAAESEREVDDVDSKFNLHFPSGEVGVDEAQYKRPNRISQYSICSKAGLWEVVNKFGYSSEQFGLQISLEKMRMNELEDAEETPEEMASNFTCVMFESPQAVLKGARHMAAVEISGEPCVRKHVHSIFMDNAVVSTIPTAEGNAAIDTFHQFAGVKWLRDKPLTRFEDAQWLLIQKAEEEKLLQVTIKLPDGVLHKLIADSNDYYLSDGVSKFAQLWNEQRKMILQDAISGFLIPSMEKEARSLLTSRAKNWLLMEYGKLFWDKISVAPYKRNENDVSSDEGAAPRVMACCWGPGKPATAFVMLDSSGEVVDMLDAGNLSVRSQNINDQQRKRNDQQRVVKFMSEHQPHVVVLGAVNVSCTRLKEDIYEIIFKMVEDVPRDVGQEMDGLNIIYGDESLPHLYENSRISLEQLSGHSGIVRRAVALGRYLQSSLAMVATLCGPGREILSWKLCPLESFLMADEKYRMVEQVMVDVTNQVGLDVNLAIAHEWLFSPLQFISGLGPRKAASLQRSLVRAGSIYTRKDFLTAHGLGKKVFVNAVGFLRIRRTGLAASSSQFINLLDDTRLHPESYGLALELAKDIYIADVQDGGNDDEDMLEMAIEHVREKPDLLKYFEVDEYVKSKKRENKRETIENIRLELIQGCQDWRRKYVEPSQDEEFYMISGETDDTLAEGRIVQATVRRAQPQKAICALESGLTGVLTREDYTDDGSDDVDLSEKLHVGDILTCRIKSIQMNRYQIFLTCRESEMRSNRYQNHQNMDPFYHEDQNTTQCVQEKARKENELAKKHFKPRMIVHPRFQNITADEAMEFLSDKDPGESIFRPSSRGPSYLTLTLKVFDGVYAHKDIIEGGKEHKDITSLLRIGKTLKIGEDTFEDLNEVMNRYVDPLVTHLKAMLSFRKFKKGTKAEVDELLRIEKSEYPMRIVYCFGISHEHPGIFILTYIRTTNLHHEYIGLYPMGFKFRKNMFDDIDRLIAFFQRHIDDPQSMVRDRNSTPSSQSGRGDYRGGGNRDGHPSGLPRPYGGRGRGRGRGSYNSGEGNSTGNDRQDSDYGFQKWGAKDGDDGGWVSGGSGGLDGNSGDGGGSNWGSGSGGGWGSSGGGSGWGKGSGGTGSGDTDANAGNSGWGSHGSGQGKGSSGGTGSGNANAGNSGWGSSRSNSGGSSRGRGSGGGTDSGDADANAGNSGWGSHGSGTGKGSSGGTGSGDANAGNSGWGSSRSNSGGSGWGKGSGGGTGSGNVDADTGTPGWGSSNSGGSGWGKGGTGGTGSGDVSANAGNSGWGCGASKKGKGSSGGTGSDDDDGSAGKSGWGSGNSNSGVCSWGKGSSSGTGSGTVSGDVDANAGNSGWGGTKGSSVSQQADKGEWSGSSGRGGGRGGW